MVHKHDENKLSFLMRENGLISYTSDALEFSQLKTLLFTILYDTCYVLYQQLPIFGSTIPTMPRVTRVMSLHVLISYQLWFYIWPPLHSYTHTLTLFDCHSLAPSLYYWSFFYFKIFTLTMTRLGRIDEAQNILNKNEGIINHILLLLFFIICFFWLVFYSVLFFLFKIGWDFTDGRMKLKKYQTHGIYIF